MKIFMIPNNMNNNCYGLRNKLPADFLKKRGHEVKIENEFKGFYHPVLGQAIDASVFDGSDVLVLNRHYEMDTPTIRNVITYCKAKGIKVVYETDDLLSAVDPDNPAHQKVAKSAQLVMAMAMMADVCTTTGEGLKQELLKLNGNVQIVPNCIDPTKWKKRKGGNKKLRIGWAGGSSHSADLLLIIDVIRDLQKEHDFEFVIFGLVPQSWEENIKFLKGKHKEQAKEQAKIGKIPGEAPWYTKMMELDMALKKIKWSHQPFVPLAEYNDKLTELNLDIGLCPLVDTRFNRCKSAIKFYEYAMVNTLTLASKVTPYQEEINCCVKNRHNKWVNKLKQLIQDKEMRDSLLKQQREWVLENRDINKKIHLWEEVYNN